MRSPQASVSMRKVLEKSGIAKTGVVIMATLRASNAS